MNAFCRSQTVVYLYAGPHWWGLRRGSGRRRI